MKRANHYKSPEVFVYNKLLLQFYYVSNLHIIAAVDNTRMWTTFRI
jgi:hypothetical protein